VDIPDERLTVILLSNVRVEENEKSNIALEIADLFLEGEQ